jgi:hypothetical protein
VADPGCLSRIPDSDFYPSRISDPGSRIQKQQQKRGVKKSLLSYLFFISQNCKLFYFINVEEKILANFKKILELFTKKIVTKLSSIWVRDPRSGIQKKPIPDPGVKKAPVPGSGSATL